MVLGELRYCINKRRCDSPKACMDHVVDIENWCWARCVSAGILVRAGEMAYVEYYTG